MKSNTIYIVLWTRENKEGISAIFQCCHDAESYKEKIEAITEPNNQYSIIPFTVQKCSK